MNQSQQVIESLGEAGDKKVEQKIREYIAWHRKSFPEVGFTLKIRKEGEWAKLVTDTRTFAYVGSDGSMYNPPGRGKVPSGVTQPAAHLFDRASWDTSAQTGKGQAAGYNMIKRVGYTPNVGSK